MVVSRGRRQYRQRDNQQHHSGLRTGAREGVLSGRSGRPLTAAGIAELLRNPIYNGCLGRFRGLADE